MRLSMNIKKQILPLILILCGFFTPHAYAMHEGNENLQHNSAPPANVAESVIEFEVNEGNNRIGRLLAGALCVFSPLILPGTALYFGKAMYDNTRFNPWYYNIYPFIMSLSTTAAIWPIIKNAIANTYHDGFEIHKNGYTANFRRIFYPKKIKIPLRADIDAPQDSIRNTMLMLNVSQTATDYNDPFQTAVVSSYQIPTDIANRVQRSRAHFCLALLKAGADVNRTNNFGQTALLKSLNNVFARGVYRDGSCMPWVHFLLIGGVDVSIQNNSGETVFEKIASAEAEYSTMPAIERDQNQGNFTDLQMIKELCKNPQLAFDSATQQEKEMFKARFPDRPFKYVPASLDEALLLYNRFDNRQALLTYLRETYDIFKAFADTKGDDKNVSPEFRVDTPLANEIFSNLDPERTEKLKAALEKADKCGHRELVTCLKAHGASYSRPQPTEWTSFNDELHAYDTVLPAVPVHVKERSVMNCQKME